MNRILSARFVNSASRKFYRQNETKNGWQVWSGEEYIGYSKDALGVIVSKNEGTVECYGNIVWFN